MTQQRPSKGTAKAQQRHSNGTRKGEADGRERGTEGQGESGRVKEEKGLSLNNALALRASHKYTAIAIGVQAGARGLWPCS